MRPLWRWLRLTIFLGPAVHRLDGRLARISLFMEKIMSLAEEIKAKLDAINLATNNLALVVADIRSQLGNPSVTEAEKQELLGLLDGVVSQLNGIAADPNNPVPPAPLLSVKKK